MGGCSRGAFIVEFMIFKLISIEWKTVSHWTKGTKMYETFQREYHVHRGQAMMLHKIYQQFFGDLLLLQMLIDRPPQN